MAIPRQGLERRFPCFVGAGREQHSNGRIGQEVRPAVEGSGQSELAAASRGGNVPRYPEEKDEAVYCYCETIDKGGCSTQRRLPSGGNEGLNGVGHNGEKPLQRFDSTSSMKPERERRRGFQSNDVCSVFHTAQVEIFFHNTCRNISCRSPLPANDCLCEYCRSMTGFYNQCMCVMCSKFDFDANTFRWLGCDVCSHWTHSDCVMREGAIVMGVSTKGGSERAPVSSELIFCCRACGSVSELLGWARDVFQNRPL